MNALFFLSIVILSIKQASTKDFLFRPVSQEYNQDLQRLCANPQFSVSEDGMGIPPQKANTLGQLLWSSLIGTQNRQVLIVERPSSPVAISSLPDIASSIYLILRKIDPTVRLMVGGVCHSKGNNCDEVDMVEVQMEFAAYQPAQSPHEQERNTTIYIYNMNHDMAIIQLTEDLQHHFGGENITDLTRPACLPRQDMKVPDLQHVYGWGQTEDNVFSPHLMEVELHLLDLENDPLAKDPTFLDPSVNYTLMCQEKRLYCMHSTEGNGKKDGGGGDSGSGIVSRIGPLAYQFGSTIAGSANGFALNIATRTQEFAYLLCHHTGVCTEKEWIGNTDPSKIHIKYTAFFDAVTKEMVIKD